MLEALKQLMGGVADVFTTPPRKEVAARLDAMTRSWTPMRPEILRDTRTEPDSLLPQLNSARIFTALAAAERGDTRDLFTLYRDMTLANSHLQGELSKRLLSVLGDTWRMIPASDAPEDVAAAETVRAALERLPGWLDGCAHLLRACLWPVALVERTYKPAAAGLGLTYDLAEMRPVPDTLLDYRCGRLQIELCDQATGKPRGQWAQPEPARYLVHRGHLLSVPDNWGGPMRSVLFWFFLQLMVREWWSRYLDKFGQPFIVGKFDRSDDTSRQVLERAFALSTKIGGLVVNHETQVELVQAAAGQSGEAYERFFTLCNREISKLIVGQTLSSEAQSTGLGSGTSKLQGDVRQDIRQWDALKLSATLRAQLFVPFLTLNGIAGQAPAIAWGAEDTGDVLGTADAVSKLKSAGIIVAQQGLETLSKRVGLPLEREEVAAAAVAPPPPKAAARKKALAAPAPAADPSAAANGIAQLAAKELAEVYRGSMAPVPQIILGAATPEEAQAQLLTAFADWSAQQAAEVVETAVTAGAWNGLA
ncbi:MAG: DUF935 family protein [Caulobacteraceae bacterium]|nr:DUF935 family protein [Caulobacteraceae bacterium]